ncbi:myeloid leukemia factor 1 [Plakobranchus ocellatus]|uniref:Myeloid leukemia factor 1 n=1 Tax=Plakobranchus ocellatus TaxID=259542 RepID=A0AAV4AMI0_9GAST|nr:myeloid leukemia factor 1 [Plakobranchus ocellatus]
MSGKSSSKDKGKGRRSNRRDVADDQSDASSDGDSSSSGEGLANEKVQCFTRAKSVSDSERVDEEITK